MNAPQIIFDFLPQKSFLQDDFIVSPSNIDAYRMVTSWPRLWENKCLVLCGEKACGKSYLSKIWQEISGAKIIDLDKFDENNTRLFNGPKPVNIIIEDIEKFLPAREETIFHIYNNVINSKGSILFTTSKPLLSLDVKLPDLRSRLGAAGVANIMQPDNELLKGLVFKQFSDLQIHVPMNLVEFLVPRIERSFEGVVKIVELINRKSLEGKRSVTIPFVKEILGL